MIASRKAVFLQNVEDEGFRDKLSRAHPLPRACQAMLKDAHLAEAANATDRIVVSRDEIVRNLFRDACQDISELREILWANPDIEEEQVVRWLERGARVEPKRKLGAR